MAVNIYAASTCAMLHEVIKAKRAKLEGRARETTQSLIWELMRVNNEALKEQAEMVGAAATADGEGSHDDVVEEAVQLFLELNADQYERRVKWENIKMDAQVR